MGLNFERGHLGRCALCWGGRTRMGWDEVRWNGRFEIGGAAYVVCMYVCMYVMLFVVLSDICR